MEEIWKDIKGYEGIYKVSNLGNVLSLKRTHKSGFQKRLKLLKQHGDTSGYPQVVLYKDGERKTYKVHRLVAESFIENPFFKPEVNHKDGVKTNNVADNLEWCTRKENMFHAKETGLWEIKDNGRSISVVAKGKNGEPIRFKSKKECSNYFGFDYWWYHNQVKYHGEPFEHDGYIIGVEND